MSSNGTDKGGVDAPAKKPPQKYTEVEKIYQKKSQLEHILLRPDTYIGSVEHVKETMWVFDSEAKTMVQREITYVPGLYKIFDEILVNAADNKQRDPTMDTIKIDIDPEANTISVFNNGKGIPVVEHKDEKMYVPTLIFGHLLTSSNYNDDEEKVTGGRNGYGAKLCNIFSTKFTVETACTESRKKFKQTWGSNMGKASEASIKDYRDKDFTKVIFSPDLAKFKMTKLDKDIVDLMSRRAYDIAASTRGVKVFLNGSRVAVKNFKEYVDLYVKGKVDETDHPLKVVHEIANERWEVAVTTSAEGKGFLQVSFVNSIATTKGGRHVDHVVDAIVKDLVNVIKKKNKGGHVVKPFTVRSNLWVFINCLIVNPTFDSQTKENMTLMVKSFGSKCQLSEPFLARVAKCGVVDLVLTWAKFKAKTQMDKVGGAKKSKLSGIPKLEDANDAGTKQSVDCTLILTEGDSAKTLAVSGLAVIGRDKYGVFPLKGKLLNVRDASHKQILENAEINNLIKIMGLQYKRQYETREDLKSLRYGRIMIMTDQDQDGSHIKGLLINFLHTNWPSLLKIPFLEEFITPIVKASKGSKELPFYSLPEFEEWKTATANFHTYKIKYYKGLGTSTSKEAKEYFSDMLRHRILFKYGGPDDDNNIKLAFSKQCIEQRKDWLTNWMEDSKQRKELGLGEIYLYQKDTKAINYTDFVNKELVLFSNMDNERSIPNMLDGLKPGQRKVLFTCLKRNDKKEVKVAQLAGSVGEKSAYHHGEASLMGTIINLAQNYVGSNNINLLQPIGQFGTRLTGGKDAASPRYIFTMLSPLAKLIFHPHDEALLETQYDDGLKIEPTWYIPIIPMVLVNGADGIGTGWMTKIQNYNPREIIENIRGMLAGEEPKLMLPWYKNFKGTIEEIGESRCMIYGEVSVVDDDEGTVEITELPVGVWTQNYKENVLEPMCNAEKGPSLIQEYKEYNTDTTVRFVITMAPDKLRRAEAEGLHKFFKIQTSLTSTSMCAFDQTQCLHRYETVIDILKDFYKIRLSFYDKRKNYLEGVLEAEALKLSNQARFIIEKCDGTLVIENKKKVLMVEELKKKKFDADPVRAWKRKQNRDDALAEEAAAAAENSQDEEPEGLAADYDYLLSMAMWCLTLERKNEIIKKRDEKLQELSTLQEKSPGDLWREDLGVLEEEMEKVEAKEREDDQASSKIVSKDANKKAPGKRAGAVKQMAMVECLPSPHARKVAPKVDEETRKKFTKVARPRKGPKKEKGGEEEKDEFDLMGEKGTVSLQARLGTTPDMEEKKLIAKRKENDDKKMKQTKLTFKAKVKSPKKPSWDGGSESESDDSIAEVVSSQTSEPTRQVQRRTAATKAKFTFDSDSDEVDHVSSESELSLHDNRAATNGSSGPVTDRALASDDDSPAVPQRKSVFADSDDDSPSPAKKKAPAKRKPDPKSNESSDAMFDSLIGLGGSPNGAKSSVTVNISSDDSATPPAKKPKKMLMNKNADLPKPAAKRAAATKKPSWEDSNSSDSDAKPVAKKAPAAKKSPATKKPAPSKKKKASSGSDSDDMFQSKKSKKPASKKKKDDSDASAADEDFVLDSEQEDNVAKSRQLTTGRQRKPVKYDYGADSGSD